MQHEFSRALRDMHMMQNERRARWPKPRLARQKSRPARPKRGRPAGNPSGYPKTGKNETKPIFPRGERRPKRRCRAGSTPKSQPDPPSPAEAEATQSDNLTQNPLQFRRRPALPHYPTASCVEIARSMWHIHAPSLGPTSHGELRPPLNPPVLFPARGHIA